MRQVGHKSDKSYNIKPGWNKFVAAHRAEAKEAFKAWVLVGRPRQGPELNLKKITNAIGINTVCSTSYLQIQASYESRLSG